ncbi:o-succinylbenzoate synthase [Rhodococcoides fascians]|uniref:o-succinylbenzoate synthase n=1 Tax=Rhodococcoides fascians TaxID=1828 RepID=UPI000567387C|nr:MULTISPECIES: o-succinylbenzoate synthase [Rhodococcus]OZE98244.1 O-succinylbenzoate synthase [Rhodococcus sp. 15-1189-1-1a]OZF13225.1 O-succinylbenzoate synthase [Rhodococcus sp. 14-2686-1-2]
MTPPLDELLVSSHVLSLPMRTKFRGITTREVMLFRGPAGWGEFGPFVEYDDAESSNWLRSAVEAAWEGPPQPYRERVRVNGTVPAVTPDEVPAILARYPGVDTAKVKVAEKGQGSFETSVADDVARVRAVRALVPHVRVDANGGWTVPQAVNAISALLEDGDLEYVEQPCATVDELVELRRLLPGVRVAADESIRRAEDPLRVVRAGGADVAVVKVAPLGGMRALLELAGELEEYGVPVVVSSALDSAVGMASGLAAAAAIPRLEFACGLGTGSLFTGDVADGHGIVDGTIAAVPVEPDPQRLTALAAAPERVQWWHERVRRTYTGLR